MMRLPRRTHFKLLIGFYEPVEGKRVLKSFAFENHFEELDEFFSRKNRGDESCKKKRRFGLVKERVIK